MRTSPHEGEKPVRIVIAGRPNAGKSTLFNRLIGRRQAIVDAIAGVTRDQNTALIRRDDRLYEITDTGGIEEGRDDDHLAGRVHGRSLAALGRADVVIYLLDGKAGVAPADLTVAQRIRARGVPAVFVVNKIDRPGHEQRLVDFYSLGTADLLGISASHGHGMDDLWERVEKLTGPVAGETGDADAAEPARDSEDDLVSEREGDLDANANVAAKTEEQPPHIALIGRPNVGKSSLLNRLAGFERVLVDERPGTTRDAIDVQIIRGPRRYIVVDTAGLRRPSRIVERLEGQSAAASLTAIARAQIALLVIDATQGIADQDLRLADLAWRRGRGLIVVVNKVDLAPELAAARCQEEIERRLPQWPPLSVVQTSAAVGTGMKGLFRAIDAAVAAYALRVPTARLNTLVEQAVEAHPPPMEQGRAVKIFYSTQLDIRPPRIALFANRRGALSASYLRYLTHHLRDSLDLKGIPLHLVIRARERDERRGASLAPKTPARSAPKPSEKTAKAPRTAAGKGPGKSAGKQRVKQPARTIGKTGGKSHASTSGRRRGGVARRSGGR